MNTDTDAADAPEAPPAPPPAGLPPHAPDAPVPSAPTTSATTTASTVGGGRGASDSDRPRAPLHLYCRRVQGAGLMALGAVVLLLGLIVTYVEVEFWTAGESVGDATLGSFLFAHLALLFLGWYRIASTFTLGCGTFALSVIVAIYLASVAFLMLLMFYGVFVS